ncbi:MAG: DUF4870 domain-containing protein [Gammaproteobacteria bacterium]|nr:DUF4870 domain-containing protein [Gammaproteobacteria bacterium]
MTTHNTSGLSSAAEVDAAAATAPATSAPTTAVTSNDLQTLIVLVHLSGLVGSFLVPLLVYLSRPVRDDVLALAAKEALNFQITLALAWLLTFATVLVLVGLLFMPLLVVVSIGMPIWAAVLSARGETVRYPLILRLIR